MLSEALLWKLRRVAAGMRQQDVARLTGISTSRFSGIERGEVEPSQTDRLLIERLLPPFPGDPFCRVYGAATGSTNGTSLIGSSRPDGDLEGMTGEDIEITAQAQAISRGPWLRLGRAGRCTD
jgi:transcriptional regulator with XRE-family HTH domain